MDETPPPWIATVIYTHWTLAERKQKLTNILYTFYLTGEIFYILQFIRKINLQKNKLILTTYTK